MVKAILEAAAELFGEQGYARTTTNKIAERAGVSVGSLYQYFPNKDSLLAALLHQHHAEVHEIVREALEQLNDLDVSLEDALRQLLGDLVELHQNDPQLTRALSSEVLRHSPIAKAVHQGKDERELEHEVVSALARRPDVRSGNHQAMAMVLGQTTAQLSRWLVHETPSEADPGPMIDEVLELLVRYLSA